MATYNYTLQIGTIADNSPRFLWRNTVIESEPSLDDVSDELTYSRAALPSVMTFELLAPIACNAIGISGGDWAGQVVSVDYDDGSGWTNCGSWQGNTKAAMLSIFDFQTAAKWRVSVTGSPLTVSVIKLGMALAMQRKQYGDFSPLTKNYEVNPQSQLGAHFVGRQLEVTRRDAKYSYKNLKADWYRAFMKPFQIDTPNKSVFCAWRPTLYPLEVVYGWLTKPMKPTNQGIRDYVQVDFTVEGFEK